MVMLEGWFTPPSYKGHRYPVEVISHCVWLYHRFPLSFREVEELLHAAVRFVGGALERHEVFEGRGHVQPGTQGRTVWLLCAIADAECLQRGGRAGRPPAVR
ncbi:hypothetical protein AB0D62_38185 [Streptomyces massasporeus]|uniref:hypothetical protein n=1 Tax=Streptomyces massasporeus TaxID=67324 RepID=UPI0033F45AF1